VRSVPAVKAVMREPLPTVLYVSVAVSVATGRASVVGKRNRVALCRGEPPSCADADWP